MVRPIFYQVRLKDIPVLIDLLWLPRPVLTRRLSKRLFKKEVRDINIDLDTFHWSDRSLFDLNAFHLAQLDISKWERLTDLYLSDRLCFLGSGWISILNQDGLKGVRPELGMDEPDWNRIHKTGDHTPIGISSEAIGKVLSTDGMDVKYCWEFGRMHHLPQLAVASRIFPGRKNNILQKVRLHLLSFIDQCPVGKGVHWSSPMEASIRMSNILVCLDLLPELREEVIRQSCIVHWKFIREHLEHKEGLGTNHYLSNLMGLLVFAVYFCGDKVEPTANDAWMELKKEISKQFFQDGVNFEYSTYYHRLSTEICLLGIQAALRSGRKLDSLSSVVLSKALFVLNSLIKPDGSLPRFGDNDSGRIIDLDPVIVESNEFLPYPEHSGFMNHSYLRNSIYASLYKEVLDNLADIDSPENLGIDQEQPLLSQIQTWTISHDKVETDEIEYTHFPEGGIVIFKSSNYYLAINYMANPNGHRYRGHMHNDKGSFELTVAGKDLIIDPGTLSYTQNVIIRNDYRSTAAHPIPYTGIEQNRYLSTALGSFHSLLDVKCKLLRLSKNELSIWIEYRGVRSLRNFRIHEDKLTITDSCNQSFTVNKEQKPTPALGYGRLK